MEWFTLELFSNASAQIFPDNTLISFRKMLTEQLNLEGQREVVILEMPDPTMYQSVTGEKLMFSEKFYNLLTASFSNLFSLQVGHNLPIPFRQEQYTANICPFPTLGA